MLGGSSRTHGPRLPEAPGLEGHVQPIRGQTSDPPAVKEDSPPQRQGISVRLGIATCQDAVIACRKATQRS